MKSLPLVALTALSVPLMAAVATPAEERTRLTLLGTTDLHGHIWPTSYLKGDAAEDLGLAKVATLVKRERAKNPNVVLVDSGDLLQGSPLTDWFIRHGDPRKHTHPMVDVLNLMGYTAWDVGNHDFNYGLDILGKARRDARYPFVSANAYHHGTKDPFFRPWIIREVGGVKVGIIGATPPGVAIWDRFHVEGKLDFGDIVEAFRREVPEMKAHGAEVVLGIPHSGLGGDGPHGPTFSGYSASSGLPPENVVLRLADEVPGLDVVFAGHSHQDVPGLERNGVSLAQAEMWGKRLAVARLELARRLGEPWRIVARDVTTLGVQDVPPDPDVLEGSRRVHEATVRYVAAPIARTPDQWPAGRARLEDTPIVDLINEVQRWRTGAQLSAAAAFTTEAGLAAGTLTIANVAALYPYENGLVAVRITGRRLRAYIEQSARFYAPYVAGGKVMADGVRGYNYDMVSGVDYVLDVRRPPGRRLVKLNWQGKPVRDDQQFTLAVNTYRQRGGGGFDMFRDCPVVFDRQDNVRELMIDYLRQKRVVRQRDVFRRNWTVLPAGALAGDTYR
ncbi:MAG: 5'-nucleotidase C-terminal domain-containing protein [Candidatus Sericytochromatia bacterium]|nr:5'-nucleotidase C-terminal domain-containing protein [Candidatus Sericytochromatia bacterium]